MQNTQVLGSLKSTSKSHETLNVYTDRLWPCRICTYVVVMKLCERCVFMLGESIFVFVHCNLFAEIIVELKWQKHQRLIISVLVTHTLLVWVGFFCVFITSLKKKKLWSEENIYLNKLCNVKVLSSHAFCIVISFSLRCMVPLKIMD